MHAFGAVDADDERLLDIGGAARPRLEGDHRSTPEAVDEAHQVREAADEAAAFDDTDVQRRDERPARPAAPPVTIDPVAATAARHPVTVASSVRIVSRSSLIAS